MTLPINKTINTYTEMIIEKTASLYIVNNWNRDGTNQGDWLVIQVDWGSSISGTEVRT